MSFTKHEFEKMRIHKKMINKKQPNFPMSSPRTMSDFIYNSLKESIINNELKTNQRINEKELAEYFRVSRTPVREAVLRLAQEGFVQIDSYRRAVVKEISYDELREIFQVLGALDRLAISLAVDRITSKDFQKLERIHKRMEKYCTLDTIEKYLELNVNFHNEVWKAVPNELLRELLHYIRDKMQRYTFARIHAFKTPGALQRSLKLHKDLMNAIKKKEKEKLADMMLIHRGSLLKSQAYQEGIKKYLANEEQIK